MSASGDAGVKARISFERPRSEPGGCCLGVIFYDFLTYIYILRMITLITLIICIIYVIYIYIVQIVTK